jgi:ketosteroid isomerase-like protein
MSEPSNREVVERFASALSRNDPGPMRDLVAEDIVEDYPQSGERIAGRDNWIALMTAWPEHDAVHARVERVVGNEDKWVAGPSWSLMRITGTGDDYWAHGQVTYSNGETWHVVQLFTLRNGRIARIRSYFGAPFPPAEWRRPYVEVVDARPTEA